MNDEKTIPTSVRLPESLRKDLERIAKREERSLNNLMVLALRKYVREYKEK